MNTETTSGSDKRRSPRHRRSDVMQWRRLGQSDFESAWILESSDDGLAFAWRGEMPPETGRVVDIQQHPDDPAAKAERALIRRVTPAHDDLVVVAVQLIPTVDDIADAIAGINGRHAEELATAGV